MISSKGATRELTPNNKPCYLQIFFTAFPDHRLPLPILMKKGFDLFAMVKKRVLIRHSELKAFGMPVSLPRRVNLSTGRKAYTHFAW